ncbi:hypothetical protein AB0O05_21445 [Streptomyces sp. NPDC093084]|uniref:hypothetical protein n=1 Tax=Streptomyces sp. NPDC093084 TaxID=3155197 RepID=UPI00343DC007
MTAETLGTTVVCRPETGWARARRLRGRGGVRTCLRATLDHEPRGTRRDDDWNVVRGED